MPLDNTIASIDIGSSKIRTVIGAFDSENNSGNFNVLGIGISESKAIRKGNILDMEEFKNNLDSSLEEAEKMAGKQVSGVNISFNSSSFEVITSKGVVAISGSEVNTEDVERAIDMAKNGINLPNREVLKVIPEYFVVDIESGIKNPIGMSARKLEVVVNIFSMNQNILNNIRKAVGDVGIEVYDIYPNLLSAPEGVLSKRQKELGVVCVDIGSSTTGITVYEEGALKYSAIIPIGGENVTNDIALGLRTSIDVAEKLKLEYCELDLGSREGFIDEDIDMRKLNMSEDGTFSRLYLSNVVTARYEEIFHFIREELKKSGKDCMLPEGAVFVGGGSKTRGFLDLAKKNLKLPAFIGVPAFKDELNDTSINDPLFASVIGTLILSEKFSGSQGGGFTFSFSGFLDSIKKVFKKILP